MAAASKPLDNFPLVRSCSLEEVREALARLCAKPVVMSTGGVDAVDAIMNYCPVNSAWLYYRTYGVEVRLTFPETRYFLQLIPLRGSGELVIGNNMMTLMPGVTAVVSPERDWHLQCSADYEHLVLKLDGLALTRKLEAMLGACLGKPLQMEMQQDRASPRVAMLPRYVRAVADALGRADPSEPLPAWWCAQTEQLLMTMLLCCNRHNFSQMLDKDASPAAPTDVRQAEDYAAANWRRPIKLDDLTSVTDVGELSLLRSFRQYRGYSPQEFLAQIRSRRAGRLQ